MGREVRRVPADWHHPCVANGPHAGCYIPLYDGRRYAPELEAWLEGARKWSEGYRVEWDLNGRPCGWEPRDGTQLEESYEEWAGDVPERRWYTPDWPEEERTHWQMYNTTSEGTPMTPPLATPEELAQWCVDHRVSTFADWTTDYETWLSIITGRPKEEVTA